MDKKLVSQLKAMKNKKHQLTPDASWVAKNKQSLMARIETKREAPDKSHAFLRAFDIFMPRRVQRVLRPAMTMVLVLFVSIAGWAASVSASYSSLPGDFLYNVKIASEKTQIAVAGLVGDAERQSELLSNAARTRAYEAKALVAQDKLENVDKTLKKSVASLEQAQKKINTVKEKQKEKIIVTVAQVAQASDNINDTIDDVIADITNEVQDEEATTVVEQLIDTQKDIKKKGIEVVEVAVSVLDEQTTEEEKEQVEKLVKETIDNIAKDAGQEVERVEAEEIVEEVLETTASSTPAATEEATSSTEAFIEEVTEEASELEEETKQIAEAVEQTNADLKEDIEEAKQLAEEGQLTQALEKIKTVNETSADLKQTVNDTKQMTEPEQVVEEVLETASSTEPVGETETEEETTPESTQ